MEFPEKLQELRKSRGLTQEELAEALYVSRTAISKWESGRGYPSIDSLKEISAYFSVTIDELLSSDKLLSIAKKENQSNIQNICGLLCGMTDLLSFMLIVLPLYPKTVNGYVYSVSLWMYTETAAYNRMIYWALFLALIASGICRILLTQLDIKAGQNIVSVCSITLSIVTVLYLVLAREPYAASVTFLLLIIKGMLLLKSAKASG